MIKIVKFQNEANTSLLFQFDTTSKIIDDGSFLASFDCNNIRNKRGNNKDIIQKAGIKNRELPFTVVFKGSSMLTNALALLTIIEGQPTIYLDTEGFFDSYNTTYVFDGAIKSDPKRVKQSDGSYAEDYIEIKFKLLEVDQ